MDNQREKLGSRIGFILLSAGCAIGCGNVWKFPWMVGENGGAAFVLIYIICLTLLCLPVLIMEFSIGRAAQASPVRMYQKLEKPRQKWHLHGWAALFGNVALMSFYTVVTGWFIYYFVKFLTGSYTNLTFGDMISNPGVNVIYLAVTVVFGFAVLCFKLHAGLEKVNKYLMSALMLLMIVTAVYCITLPGAKDGLKFYLVPDFSKVTINTIVSAMNQALFTVSLGIGCMAIFGSYIGKEHALMSEAISVISLDTVVAICAGLIIFPACSYGNVDVGAGPALLFNTMAAIFEGMPGGRVIGTFFFLFMVFAAMSTVLTVFENILACVRELTGWSRPVGCIVCGIVVFGLSLTTALGYSVLNFQPFGEGTAFLDFWDFIVSTNLLPLGALVTVLFCCYDKIGWGWDNFLAEANSGNGPKVKRWMKPIFKYLAPAIIAFLYIYGLITFFA